MDKAEIISLGFCGFVLALVLASWPTFSYFEAKAFNNVTGKNVSTFDAMFIQLRVSEDTND